jgi:hypothetical protein
LPVRPAGPGARSFDLKGFDPATMTARLCQFAIWLATALLAGALSGCGTMNEKMSNAMGDYVPQWAGGLPSDAPPRPGTAKYDEYQKERDRLRQMPADQRPGAQTSAKPDQQQPAKPDQSGLDPVH